MGFALQPHVAFCECGGRFIFLDLRSDRYFALSGAAERCFVRICGGEALDHEGTEAARRLVAAGLLASDEGSRPQPCIAPPRPVMSLVGERGQTNPGALVHALLRLSLGAAESRLSSLETRIDRFRRRKSRIGASLESRDGALRELAAAFDLSRLIAAPHDRCLPRSLSIAHALLDARLSCDLVIGVRLKPFGAHCWVEACGHLVNEAVDEVRNFTPILVV